MAAGHSPAFCRRLVLVTALAPSISATAQLSDGSGGLLGWLSHWLPHKAEPRGAAPPSTEDELFVPEYTRREHWPPVPSINAYPGIAPLPDRCKQPILPSNETRELAPSGAMTGECFQLDLRRPDETQPVLPTLFIPGFPKAATTWLFDCIYAAFRPETVCPPQRGGDFDPRKWSLEGCGRRRYMLPGIACHVLGGCAPRKELFFYGGGYSDLFESGLASLHGLLCLLPRSILPLPLEMFTAVDRRSGGRWAPKFPFARPSKTVHSAFLISSSFTAYYSTFPVSAGPELPLEMFTALDRRSGGRWAPNLAADAVKLQRMQTFCSHPNYTHLPFGRNHPSCCTAAASNPKRWECKWQDQLRHRHGRVKSVFFHTAMPWVTPREYDFATIDATPNYMCTPAALLNIKRIAARPSDLRFIVVMRDPIMRAFSEWSMFALGWGWERESDFMRKMRAKMDALRTCNGTLFHRNDLLRALPDDELFLYVTKCFKGKAMEYITNSIYPVCVLAALRVFPREQFLFLRFEDLMRLKAPGLVRLLSNFTGLYTDDTIIRTLQERGECEAGRAKKVPLSFGKDTRTAGARKNLSAAMGEFEFFFRPYDELLAQIVHPEFAWSSETHRLSGEKLRGEEGGKGGGAGGVVGLGRGGRSGSGGGKGKSRGRGEGRGK